MGRSLEAVQREKSTLQRSTDHPAPAAVVPSITSITSPSKTVIALTSAGPGWRVRVRLLLIVFPQQSMITPVENPSKGISQGFAHV